MRSWTFSIALAVSLWFGGAPPSHAQSQRNPAGTGTLGGPTRDPSGASGAAASSSGNAPSAHAAAPTRPPLGSEAGSDARAVEPPNTVEGHTLGVGPNGVGDSGTGLGGGAPNVLNPNGANASPDPAPLSGTGSNGSRSPNGSKEAPMRANGVRATQ